LRYEDSDPSPQEPHFEYPYVEVVEFDEGERGILGSDIWTGPIPYGLPGGAGGCNGYLFNKQGEVIFKGVGGGHGPLKLDVPNIEELRSGGISGVPIPPDLKIPVEGLRAEIRCAPAP